AGKIDGNHIMNDIKKKKVFFAKWTSVDKNILSHALDVVGSLDEISAGSRILIKPNFTYPFFKPGVTTPPDLIRALVEILIERGARVTIGEGGPSLDVFSVKDSFTDHGLYDLEKEYGVRISYFRDEELTYLSFGNRKSAKNIPIPKMLIEDIDLFISLPVAKVHAMTTVSLAIKNQWGCVAANKRFLFHPSFNEIITGLHKLLPKQVVICDGRYVLTDNGPMFGTTKEGKFLSVSNDIGAFDVAMCRLMGSDPKKISHIRKMINSGMAPESLEEIEMNIDPIKFRPCEFMLKRTLQNYIALAGFNSALITWFGYDSFAAGFLHKILYAIKPNPLEIEMKEKINDFKCSDRNI
ncbi:MAG: DUF362 domain-containing protein, partial [Candidatus Hodarchaeota archaeon]